MHKRIFHIVTQERWTKYADSDVYEAGSLMEEGFIHCSFEHQLVGVIERYYSDRHDLLVLEIEPTRLASELIEEPSTNGEIYPHIYGQINKASIIAIREWNR